MPKLAIIHTTPATVEPLKALANEIMSDVTVINFVDDSILPQLRDNGGDTNAVSNRLVHYAMFAEEVGADVILEACSSVGEVVSEMQAAVAVPVIRIDEAMAEQAVARGARVGVAATLATTLRPTLRLLQQKAEQANRVVEFTPCLIDSAYQKLMAGDPDGHDQDIVSALSELAAKTDVVVLAQASMARVVPTLPEYQRAHFLTSPHLGLQRVKAALDETGT